MVRLAILVSLAMAPLSLSGCGTIGIATCGIPGPIPMYFGVQADAKEGKWLDVPFSAVADTVLLPLTTAGYAMSVVHWWNLDERQKEEAADRCPIPWEWDRLRERKELQPKEEVKARSKATELIPEE
jgi:uncharacterized protein YceK